MSVLSVPWKSPFRRTALLSVVWLMAGCPEPNLGSTPFFCNKGQPQCPEGYTCVETGGAERCVKQGGKPASGGDQRVDAGSSTGDTSVSSSDWPQLPDRRRPDTVSPIKWDGQPPPKPDLTKITDGAPPHLGCQSNTECKQQDPSAPCCCPFIVGVWTCLPLCLNPICFK